MVLGESEAAFFLVFDIERDEVQLAAGARGALCGELAQNGGERVAGPAPANNNGFIYWGPTLESTYSA